MHKTLLTGRYLLCQLPLLTCPLFCTADDGYKSCVTIAFTLTRPLLAPIWALLYYLITPISTSIHAGNPHLAGTRRPDHDLLDAWRMAVSGGVQREAEARLRRHDGAYRWFLFRWSLLRGQNDTGIGWCGISIDIDDRKRAEQQLRASEQESRSLIMAGACGPKSIPTQARHSRLQCLRMLKHPRAHCRPPTLRGLEALSELHAT